MEMPRVVCTGSELGPHDLRYFIAESQWFITERGFCFVYHWLDKLLRHDYEQQRRAERPLAVTQVLLSSRIIRRMENGVDWDGILMVDRLRQLVGNFGAELGEYVVPPNVTDSIAYCMVMKREFAEDV